jgi:diguanylate cyclase (GGDEF)-like protein
MKRALIVDDKEENLYYLEALLKGNGYDVDSARHGAEALVKARQSQPDVVVSDLLMPVMDGYTLLRHWKIDTALKQIPFIVYTATYTEPEDERLAFSMGADAFILKPSEPDDFMAKLHDVETKAASSSPSQPVSQANNEKTLLKVYSETLVRKLEEKTLQLEEANLELQRDIARRKEAEDKIEHLAFYDPLTGLPNRRLMQDRLDHSFAASSRHKFHCALLFIDLDNFKTLNDTRGHNVGDSLLIVVASRLQSCVREGDSVARLGGDEFVIVLENLSEQPEQAAKMAESVGDKVLSVLNEPYVLNNESYHGTASIGVCLFRNQEITVEELLKRADTAMYQAKSNGRNTLRFYDPAMQAALEQRMHLENDLRCALSANQFVLYYQPQVNQHGDIVGAEALIRWQDPQKGLISPCQFIPIAEETGLIVPIGQWVLETACAQIKAWEANPLTSKLQLAINISARQFHQHNFIEQVLQTLIDQKINPNRLKFELTESVVLKDISDAITKMYTLRDAGLCFSMDDFGTGYSSLSYLTQLPLSQLKIDQSFVRNVGVKRGDAVIIQTIIGMAKNLDMEVIAEGVEREDQKEFLTRHGCKFFQGYLFGKPVPIKEFEVMIKPSQ